MFGGKSARCIIGDVLLLVGTVEWRVDRVEGGRKQRKRTKADSVSQLKQQSFSSQVHPFSPIIFVCFEADRFVKLQCWDFVSLLLLSLQRMRAFFLLHLQLFLVLCVSWFVFAVTTSMQNSLAGKDPFPPNIRQLPAVRQVTLPTEFVSSYQTFKRFRSFSRIS